MMSGNTWRVLIVFNSGPVIYGLERAVIETFELLRPEVEPDFLVSHTAERLNPPTFQEINRRGFAFSFFSDTNGWPRIGWPRSFRHLGQMLLAMMRGNRDVLKAVQGKDILYVPGTSYFYFAFLAAIWCRIRRRRVIYHFHNLLTTSFFLRLISLLVTDFVHNTLYGLKAVESSNPCIRRKSNWVIPSSILPRPTAEKGNGHFAESEQHILFVGQVAKHKGIDLLLDAFLLLKKSNNNLVLHIVGDCNNLDFAKQIESTRDQFASQIKYWGYREDVIDIMKRADLLVPPSPSITNESFGRVIVEAMSVGLPSVCFRSGAFQEVVVHEQTGLVCEEETSECLARNIQRLLDDETLRARCGRSALSRYEQLYSPERVKELWRQLLARK